jgi:hypothetical protein
MVLVPNLVWEQEPGALFAQLGLLFISEEGNSAETLGAEISCGAIWVASSVDVPQASFFLGDLSDPTAGLTVDADAHVGPGYTSWMELFVGNLLQSPTLKLDVAVNTSSASENAPLVLFDEFVAAIAGLPDVCAGFQNRNNIGICKAERDVVSEGCRAKPRCQ